MNRFSCLLLLSICVVGCDSTVKNATSVEGTWTGSSSGRLFTETDTLNQSYSIEITFEEAQDGELSGTGVFAVDGGETIELQATGLRSNNQVDAAFLKQAVQDTVQYDATIKDDGRRIEGEMAWNRYENTTQVALQKQ